MRMSTTQTEIICDSCGDMILRPLAVASPIQAHIQYLNFIDTDLCSGCTIKVFHRILSSKKITEEELKETIEEQKLFQYIAPPGVTLC